MRPSFVEALFTFRKADQKDLLLVVPACNKPKPHVARRPFLSAGELGKDRNGVATGVLRRLDFALVVGRWPVRTRVVIDEMILLKIVRILLAGVQNRYCEAVAIEGKVASAALPSIDPGLRAIDAEVFQAGGCHPIISVLVAQICPEASPPLDSCIEPAGVQ